MDSLYQAPPRQVNRRRTISKCVIDLVCPKTIIDEEGMSSSNISSDLQIADAAYQMFQKRDEAIAVYA